MSNNQGDGVFPKDTQLEIVTVKEVAGLLRAQTSTIYAWAAAGRIPAIKINGILRFDLSEIKDWIDQNRLKTKENQEKATGKTFNPNRRVDVDGIVRSAIDTYAGSGISSSQGETRSNQARKGGC